MAIDALASLKLKVSFNTDGMWDRNCRQGRLAGSTTLGWRIDWIKVTVTPPPGVKLHVAGFGRSRGLGDGEWTDGLIGTRGKSRPLEGLALKLAGGGAADYSIVYQPYFQDTGWGDLTFDGLFVGNRDNSRRLEALIVGVLKADVMESLREATNGVDPILRQMWFWFYVNACVRSLSLAELIRSRTITPDLLTPLRDVYDQNSAHRDQFIDRAVNRTMAVLPEGVEESLLKARTEGLPSVEELAATFRAARNDSGDFLAAVEQAVREAAESAWKAMGKVLRLPPRGMVTEAEKEAIRGFRRAFEVMKPQAVRMEPESLVEALKPWMERVKRPAWRPIVEPGDGTPTSSKYCGTPWTGPDAPWPECFGCKVPMALLLQLRLDELPVADGRHGEGLLQFFYCPRTFLCKSHTGFVPFMDQATRVRILNPIPTGEAAPPPRRYKPSEAPTLQIVGWERFDDWPDYFENAENGLFESVIGDDMTVVCPEVNVAALTEYDPELIPDAASGDKLGGWPNWIQREDYPGCPLCGRRMGLVYQLTSHERIESAFGDFGTGHITQCPDHKEIVAFGSAR